MGASKRVYMTAVMSGSRAIVLMVIVAAAAASHQIEDEIVPEIAAMQTTRFADNDPIEAHTAEVVPKLRDHKWENRHGGYAENAEKHLTKAMLRIKHNYEIAA